MPPSPDNFPLKLESSDNFSLKPMTSDNFTLKPVPGDNFSLKTEVSRESLHCEDFLPPLNELYLRPVRQQVPEPAPAPKEDPSDGPKVASTRSILLVDDSQFERTVIRSAVEGLTRFTICAEAADGVDGIRKAVELKPDLVIMDLAMPLMNGVEAAMVLRNALPNVPIVLFTLYAEQLRGAISPGFGVTIILSKADGLGPLLECLDKLLGVLGE